MSPECSFSSGKFQTARDAQGLARFETTLSSLSFAYDTPTWCRIIEANVCLDVFFYIQKKNKVYIFGQDALIDGRSDLPFFYRTKWISELDGSFITFNDPTLYAGKRLIGGWWQLDGAIELAHAFIARMLELIELEPTDVRFYGASAGGFFSMAMAGLMPSSTAVVDIPQVDLLNSPFSANEVLLREAGVCDFRTSFHWWSTDRPPRKVIVLFNRRDERHIRTQTSIILKSIDALYYSKSVAPGELTIKIYDNEEPTPRGHSPMEKSQIIPFLRSL